jgi:hypothetical protein
MKASVRKTNPSGTNDTTGMAAPNVARTKQTKAAMRKISFHPLAWIATYFFSLRQ